MFCVLRGQKKKTEIRINVKRKKNIFLSIPVKVCDFEKFSQIMEEIEPTMPDAHVRRIFEEALEHLHQCQVEEHEAQWQPYEDPVTKRTFYYSASTNESYWYRPPLDKFEVRQLIYCIAQRHRQRG